MQNISLQSSPSSATTNISTLGSNQDSSANSTPNNENGPAFKDVLSSQVRSQQPASQPSETQQADKTKPTPDQSITQGIAQPRQQQLADTKPADITNVSGIADQSKIPAIQDIAGLSFEDLALVHLGSVNKMKKLSDDALAPDLGKSDTPPQQPLATDPALVALSMPIQANITPVQANTVPVTPIEANIAAADDVPTVLAKDNKVAVAASSTTAASVFDATAAQKTGLSTKEQADLAKTGQTNTSADLTSWVNSMLPSQGKQLDTSLSATKLDTAAVNEPVGKSVTNTSGPNLTASVALNPLNVMHAASSNIINASPGKAGWDQAISQKMVWMVGAGEQSATLTLNPPDLGPLQVVIHVHNNQADTTFISDNSDVRRALQDGLSNLKDMLSQSGINLGQANINSSQQEQQARQSSRDNSNSGSNNNQTGFTASELDSKPMQVTRVSNGLVDTFA